MNTLKYLPNVYAGGLQYFGDFFRVIAPKAFHDALVHWREQIIGSCSSEPFTVLVFGRPVIVLSSEEDVAFFNNIERKGMTITFQPTAVKNLLGDTALLNASGKHHRILRRIMEPIFAPSNLDTYTKMLDNTITKTLEEWAIQLEENKDVWHSTVKFKMLTLRLLLCLIFDDISDELVLEFHGLLQTWIDGFKSPHSFPIPGTLYYKATQAKARMESIIGEFITDFKHKYPDDNDEQSNKSKTSFLGRLIYGTDENGSRLTDIEIKTNIIFILFAGHDTTYVSMGTFLHYLTKLQPHVYDALVEEAHNVKEPLDNAGLRYNAPILNSFLAESWRVLPPVPGIARINVADNDIRYKDYLFPAGSPLLASPYLNQEEYYGETANEFCIERWLPDDHPLKEASICNNSDNSMMKDFNQISRAFKTFGVGTHSCLGHYFAKLEARIIMTRILRYDIKVRDSKLEKRPFMCRSNEFQLSVKKRHDS